MSEDTSSTAYLSSLKINVFVVCVKNILWTKLIICGYVMCTLYSIYELLYVYIFISKYMHENVDVMNVLSVIIKFQPTQTHTKTLNVLTSIPKVV